MGLLLPVLGCLGAFAFSKATAHSGSSGGWGLGEVFLFVVIGCSGFVLGFLAVGIAYVRRERWAPLRHVLAALLGWAMLFGFGIFTRRHP